MSGWAYLAAAAAGPSPAGVARRPAIEPLFGSRPNHLVPVDVFGVDTDMLPVTRAEAMSVPAMARARHLIVATLARLPLAVTPPEYEYTALLDQPEPDRPRVSTLRDTFDDILFDGWACWRVTERYAPTTNGGRPRQCEYVALGRISRDRGVTLVDDEPVPRADLLWFTGPHAGVCTFAGRSLRAAVRLDTAAAVRARNPVPAAELHQTSDDVLTDTEISQLIAQWEQALAGRGVAYTNRAVELRTHGAAPEQLLLQGRNMAAVDVARHAGVPAALVDAVTPGSSMTYTNEQAKARELVDFGLAAYAESLTARLSMDDVLPRGVSCGLDFDQLLRPSFTERMNAYSAAIDTGVYTVDELRTYERGRPREAT